MYQHCAAAAPGAVHVKPNDVFDPRSHTFKPHRICKFPEFESTKVPSSNCRQVFRIGTIHDYIFYFPVCVLCHHRGACNSADFIKKCVETLDMKKATFSSFTFRREKATSTSPSAPNAVKNVTYGLTIRICSEEPLPPGFMEMGQLHCQDPSKNVKNCVVSVDSGSARVMDSTKAVKIVQNFVKSDLPCYPVVDLDLHECFEDEKLQLINSNFTYCLLLKRLMDKELRKNLFLQKRVFSNSKKLDGDSILQPQMKLAHVLSSSDENVTKFQKIYRILEFWVEKLPEMTSALYKNGPLEVQKNDVEADYLLLKNDVMDFVQNAKLECSTPQIDSRLDFVNPPKNPEIIQKSTTNNPKQSNDVKNQQIVAEKEEEITAYLGGGEAVPQPQKFAESTEMPRRKLGNGGHFYGFQEFFPRRQEKEGIDGKSAEMAENVRKAVEIYQKSIKMRQKSAEMAEKSRKAAEMGQKSAEMAEKSQKSAEMDQKSAENDQKSAEMGQKSAEMDQKWLDPRQEFKFRHPVDNFFGQNSFAAYNFSSFHIEKCSKSDLQTPPVKEALENAKNEEKTAKIAQESTENGQLSFQEQIAEILGLPKPSKPAHRLSQLHQKHDNNSESVKIAQKSAKNAQFLKNLGSFEDAEKLFEMSIPPLTFENSSSFKDFDGNSQKPPRRAEILQKQPKIDEKLPEYLAWGHVDESSMQRQAKPGKKRRNSKKSAKKLAESSLKSKSLFQEIDIKMDQLTDILDNFIC